MSYKKLLGEGAIDTNTAAKIAMVSPHCIRKWIHKGYPGPAGRIYLESCRTGAKLLTSKQAVERFMDQCNAPVEA